MGRDLTDLVVLVSLKPFTSSVNDNAYHAGPGRVLSTEREQPRTNQEREKCTLILKGITLIP